MRVKAFTTETEFLDVVLKWLRARDPYYYGDVRRVTAVLGSGTSWEGDTESGFHDSFEVLVRFELPDGRSGSFTARGDDMDSLWETVVGDHRADGAE